MTELTDRILEALAKATSKAPANAEVTRGFLDVPQAEFNTALERLARECRISTAHITRQGKTWLAIWPTGVCMPSAGWSNNSHSVLFEPSAPIVPALRDATAPRTRPARATRKAQESAMPAPTPTRPAPESKVAPPATQTAATKALRGELNRANARVKALQCELDRARAALRLGAGEIAELAVLHLRGDSKLLSRRLSELVKNYPPLAAMRSDYDHLNR